MPSSPAFRPMPAPRRCPQSPPVLRCPAVPPAFRFPPYFRPQGSTPASSWSTERVVRRLLSDEINWFFSDLGFCISRALRSITKGQIRRQNVAQLAQLTTNPGSCSSEGALGRCAPDSIAPWARKRPGPNLGCIAQAEAAPVIGQITRPPSQCVTLDRDACPPDTKQSARPPASRMRAFSKENHFSYLSISQQLFGVLRIF